MPSQNKLETRTSVDEDGLSDRRRSAFGLLLDRLRGDCHKVGIWSNELSRDLPKKWEKHGNMVLLPENAFLSPQWRKLGRQLWATVAECLKVERVARKRRIANDDFRSPHIELLFGADGWVEHKDNAIRYQYDVTKCMFSIGNISEKIRIAKMDCRGETVVDLFAGIGYFTLPYLVHAQAGNVHACEWNPDAVEALKRNLVVNKVDDRATVYEGDCRKMAPRGIADRVNLGLLPTAKPYWMTAVRTLAPTGGVLHIHENITSAHVPTGQQRRRAQWGRSATIAATTSTDPNPNLAIFGTSDTSRAARSAAASQKNPAFASRSFDASSDSASSDSGLNPSTASFSNPSLSNDLRHETIHESVDDDDDNINVDDENGVENYNDKDVENCVDNDNDNNDDNKDDSHEVSNELRNDNDSSDSGNHDNSAGAPGDDNSHSQNIDDDAGSGAEFDGEIFEERLEFNTYRRSSQDSYILPPCLPTQTRSRSVSVELSTSEEATVTTDANPTDDAGEEEGGDKSKEKQDDTCNETSNEQTTLPHGNTDSGCSSSTDLSPDAGATEETQPSTTTKVKVRRKISMIVNDSLDAEAARPYRLKISRDFVDAWENIDPAWRQWTLSAAQTFLRFANNLHDDEWAGRVQRVGRIKSYAPHIDHVVLDLELRPIAELTKRAREATRSSPP